MKKTIESLGKTNQKYLKNLFGFKTIRQAKKALGADNDQEAYAVMRELYNQKIEEELQAKKQKNKQVKMQDKLIKKNFKSVIGEINKRKKIYTVALVLDVKVSYTDKDGKIKEYPTYLTIQKTYLARNETELEEMISNEVADMYPMEDSKSVSSVQGYNYKISEEKKHNVGPLDVPMKRGKPYKASFLQYGDKIDPISYEDFNGECVLKMLMQYMNIKKEKTLIQYFDDASRELYNKPYHKNNGITSRMILNLCQTRNISCLGFDQRSKNFVKHTADHSKKRKFRPIIFYMFMSHFYLITDHSLIASLSATFRQNNNIFHSSLEVADDKEDKNEITYYSNLPVSDVIELDKNSVVIYDKTDLINELREYIDLTNDIPKVKNHSITQIGKILLSNNRQMVISGCLGEGLEWESILNICNKAGIKFKNQSIGTLLCELRDKFFIMKRAKFTQTEREAIRTEQQNKCKKCEEILSDKYHIDHIKPVSSGGSNDRENLQALCVSCHVEKCREEKEACEYIQSDNITSAFNLGTNALIESEHFRKVAFTQSLKGYGMVGDQKYSKDMNKCRRNILLHYGYDFPRYSVLDDIELFDGKLATGFYYVESQNKFPLRKNGMYSLPMVKYCLENNIIKMSDIKYQFKSSFNIPSDYFQSFVEYLDTVFDGDDFLKKLSVNSLVGLFGRRKNTFIESRLCDKNELEDIACAYQDFAKPYLNVINSDVVQVAGQNEIKKIESTFPLHAQILDCEAIELHKLVMKLKAYGGTPYEIKTDAVSYYSKEVINFEEGNFWDKAETLKKYKDEEAKDIIRSVKIYNEEPIEFILHQYEHHEQDDDYERLAKTLVEKNKGCLILGPAGTGKTYLVNQIKNEMINKGLKVKCLAPTNKAALLLNGETLHKFSHALLNKKNSIGKYKTDCLIVDEISMMSELFYQVLLILKNYNPSMKIFMVGDFGQLPPVNDRVTKDYEKCRALFELVDGFRLELTKCKRSDDVHFNNCMNVRKGLNIDISKFPNAQDTYLNVCYTNNCRKAVNDYYMKKYLAENNNKKTLEYQPLSYDKNTQKMIICAGMPVMARINDKGLDIVNNELFTIKTLTDEVVTVTNEMKEEVNIPATKFHKLFSLAFCITIHKSQGATFDGKYTIYEWEKLDRKLRYVALSRATDEKNVQIVKPSKKFVLLS